MNPAFTPKPRAVRHKPSTLNRTHCLHGHPWTAENIRTDQGILNCITCGKQRSIANRLRDRAEHAALYI